MPILSPGEQVRDTYEVERLLGEGAFAEVYRVRHRFMGRQAMKVFKAAGATIEDIERDIFEAVVLSKLKHPNIIEVFDANILNKKQGQYGYFTMTHVAGGTLDRHWRSFGAAFMPVGQVVEITKQICRGLAIAHSSTPPIVHRDIKPQNILIGFDTQGIRVRISDFGLAKAVNPLTMLLTSKGTLGYKPPESMYNVDSCAADVWAIGTMMYLLLTDKLPFPTLDERDVNDANRFLRKLRPPSIHNIAVDPLLSSIVEHCLAPKASDRFPSALELLAALDSWKPHTSNLAVDSSRPSAKPLLNDESPNDMKREAEKAAREAFRIARDPTLLSSAADLLEEALSKDPALQARYGQNLKLWRLGAMDVSIDAFSSDPKSKPNSR